MTAYYRNRETGLVQAHPVSGLGESFNSDEIGEDGKPVKPYTSLAPTADELRAAKALLKDPSANPLDVAASEAFLAAATKNSEKAAARKAAAEEKKAEAEKAAAAKAKADADAAAFKAAQTTAANSGSGDTQEGGN